MRKKEISKYYKLEPKMDIKGRVKEEAVYVGGYYDFTDQVFSRANAGSRLFTTSLLLMALLIIGTFPDGTGLRQVYIALPYICTLIPAALTVTVGWGFKKADGRLTEVEYHDTVLRGKGSTTALCILCGYCIVADLTFSIVQFAQITLWKEILFIIINIISLLLSYIQLKYIKVLNKKLTFCE